MFQVPVLIKLVASTWGGGFPTVPLKLADDMVAFPTNGISMKHSKNGMNLKSSRPILLKKTDFINNTVS